MELHAQGSEQHRRRRPRRRAGWARPTSATWRPIPNAHVVVVADPVRRPPEAGRELARRDRASTDPIEAINDPDVEAVVIVTPTSTHADA